MAVKKKSKKKPVFEAGDVVRVKGHNETWKVIGYTGKGKHTCLSLRGCLTGYSLIAVEKDVRHATKRELAIASALDAHTNAAKPDPAPSANRPPLPENFERALRLWAVSQFFTQGRWPMSGEAATFFGVEESEILSMIARSGFVYPPKHLRGMIIPFNPTNRINFEIPGRTVRDSLMQLRRMVNESINDVDKEVPFIVIRDVIGGALAMIDQTHSGLRACGIAGNLNRHSTYEAADPRSMTRSR